jgi:hypothetical protein
VKEEINKDTKSLKNESNGNKKFLRSNKKCNQKPLQKEQAEDRISGLEYKIDFMEKNRKIHREKIEEL